MSYKFIGTHVLINVLKWRCAGFVGERRSGINQSVEDDVNKIFRGKTLAQLGLLEQQIQTKLQGGEGVDVGTYVHSQGHIHYSQRVVLVQTSLECCTWWNCRLLGEPAAAAEGSRGAHTSVRETSRTAAEETVQAQSRGAIFYFTFIHSMSSTNW